MSKRYQIIERIPTIEEYRSLCISVGWEKVMNLDTAADALPRSLYGAVAVLDEQVVGMGRIVGDGAIFYYLQDVVVVPEHQGQGLGTWIVDRLVTLVQANAPEKAFLGVFAAPGTLPFYQKFGLDVRPSLTGMYQVIPKRTWQHDELQGLLEMKDRDKLVKAWKREEQEPFTGWDFSHLDGRMVEEQPPWSYSARAAELMDQASSVLDMGTGGGERLLALRDHWPEKVTITEDYPPNVKLATEQLEPLGVRVVELALNRDTPMPFAHGEFDLVLNRHSGSNHAEIARILAPGGTFFTQQVHGLTTEDLLAAFDAEPKWPHATPENKVRRLKDAGLTILVAEEWAGDLFFTDVGAIVYYLKAIPWLVEGFSVETHLKHLLALQDRLERGEGLVFEARKYLVEARREP